MILKYSDKDIN